MRTYQQIIDDIDAILASDQDPSESELGALEIDYVKAIQDVNARLKKADELLRKGHRAEALGLCEAEPNLLDAVQILDFPDREAWAEFVQDYGLPAPPQLKIEIATDLNEAYPQEQQLAPLLRRHRFLALGRSDLRSRIDVMRKIAKVDRANPIWSEDLQEFERARHTEIQREFKDAVGRRDGAAVAMIERELIDPRWLIAPPKSVIKQAQVEHARLRAAHARQDLETLEPDLTAAFADFDLARGRQLRERWNARAAIANLESGDPLLEMVAPAFDWLAGEDRREQTDAEYAAAVAELERGLDDNVDRLDLERRYHAVTRLERGLDPTLERRLAERLGYLEVERTRKNRLRLTAIVSVVVVVAALVAFGIFRHLRSSTIATHAANLEQLIGNMQLSQARDYVSKLQSDLPYVFESARVQGLIGELQTAEQSDEGRRIRRAEHVAAVQSVLGGPQFASIDAAAAAADVAFASLRQAESETGKARDLSSTDAELADINRLETQAADLKQKLQNRIDELFRQAFDGLLERLDQAGPADRRALGQLRDEALALANRKHVSLSLVAQIEPLVTRIRAMDDAARAREEEARSLVELTRRVDLKDREGFVVRLEAFAQQFPETERGQSFSRIARQEADLWKGAEAWQSLIDKWSRKDLAAAGAAEASALIQDATAVLDVYGKFPPAARLRELVEHLQSITRRVDAGGQKLSLRLMDPLNNPTVFDIYTLRTKDKSYFSKERPRMLGSDWQIKYVKDTTLTNTQAQRFPPVDITNDKKGQEYIWEAPQFLFSRDALDALAQMKDAEWEATFLALLDRLYDDRNMDSVLKLQLMGIFLQVACEGSGVLKQAFSRHVEALQNARLGGTVNWLDPDDKEGRNARIQASGVLSRMTPPRDVRKVVEDALARLKNPLIGDRYDWIGWLQKDSGNAWTCEVPLQKRPAGRGPIGLFVLVRPSADADVVYEKVGEYRDGALKMQALSPSAAVEGRPVYALKK
ncbi:MAG TPA: hypothetical protein VML55_25265 [Planctomycetaceae bacterium]|nr:hypothetical protein [Planctomycetaceae bacterium]